jgi:putative alpha-1,2-mannosidase
MRGRRSDGSWVEPFDEYDWGGPYVEGSAWQHAFEVPHDAAGLIALMGGR